MKLIFYTVFFYYTCCCEMKFSRVNFFVMKIFLKSLKNIHITSPDLLNLYSLLFFRLTLTIKCFYYNNKNNNKTSRFFFSNIGEVKNGRMKFSIYIKPIFVRDKSHKEENHNNNNNNKKKAFP